MKLNELFKPEQTASLQNFKDYYDNATQSMITRVKAGENYHEVINQLAREFASSHNDSYEMFDLMADGLKKRHWEMFWDDEKKENEKETPVAIVVQPEEPQDKEVKEYDGPDETQDNAGFSDKEIKMAFGILNDPRFKQGNYSGAYAAIEKIAKGLASHPSVANALKRANESE
jgi:hypothetical protein